MTLASAALWLTPAPGMLWALTAVFFLIALAGGVLAVIAMRRYFRDSSRTASEPGGAVRTDNPAAFVTASMQAVIQKLKDQEKELELLHKAERERAKQTERLSEAVTRNMPAGLLLVGASGVVTSANPAAELALGVKALAFRRCSEVLGEDSQLTQLIGGCLRNGTTYRREEIEYLTPARELRQLGVTISPILDGAGAVTGAICLLSDLTELAALQKQIHLKENMAALGELSAGIAHEFKNALATISGYAQMVRSEAAPGSEVREHGEKILQQTRSLTHVVTEFLKFARPLQISVEQVDLQPMMDRIVGEISEAVPGVSVSASGEFAEVAGDDALLFQALLNVVRNAAEAASENSSGGHVLVRGELDHSAPHPGQRILVLDNGPGIPPESLMKIFVPFYTTKSQGTGLGLPVVQKILVQHGGAIEARNRPEGGAEFVVWLPFVRELAQAIDSPASRI